MILGFGGKESLFSLKKKREKDGESAIKEKTLNCSEG